MDTFIYTLAAAALSGLTFIAYRHPRVYAKLSWLINSMFVGASAYMIGWNSAVSTTQLVARQHIPLDKSIEAISAFGTLEYSLLQSVGLPFLLIGYHIFLLILPHMMAHEKHTDA